MEQFPRIIHQTWETRDVPSQWKEAQQGWIDFCAQYGFEYKLWTASDRRALVADKHMWYLSAFDQFPMNVQRADAWRYFVLHEEGGWYFDLDFAPKPEIVYALFQFYNSIPASIAIAKSATANDFGKYGEILTNACILSKKHSPFWPYVWEEMKLPQDHCGVVKNVLKHIPYFHVIFGTGPGLINNAMKRYVESYHAEKFPLVKIPCEFISCGYEWDQKPFQTTESAVRLLPGSSWHTKPMAFFRKLSYLSHQRTAIMVVVIAFLFVICLFLCLARIHS